MRRAIHPQQTQAFFVRGPSPFARLVLFAALSLTLMATDSRLHYLTEIRQGAMALLHPLQIAANAPVSAFYNTQEYLSSHDTLLKDNQELRQQALLMGAELQRFKSLENENAQLRNLLGAAQASKQPAMLGEILHMGRDPFVHKIVVNLGSHQDIMPGQAVIDGAGVIGQVTRVYPFSSEVTLITDKELAIPIQVERNGLRAIAFGHGRDTTIDLPYLPANVDIRKGDKLVTSGIDGIYPTGLAVAEVVSISSNANSPFAHIVCKPVAGIENHRQILLLGMVQPEIATGLPPPPPTVPEAKSAKTAKESRADKLDKAEAARKADKLKAEKAAADKARAQKPSSTPAKPASTGTAQVPSPAPKPVAGKPVNAAPASPSTNGNPDARH